MALSFKGAVWAFLWKAFHGRNQDRRTVYGASTAIATKDDGGASFQDTKVGYYVKDFDKDTVKQFAALCFLLPDGTNYVSFRGTDETITGWREDFLMSCQSETSGAKEAVSYFNKVAKALEGKFILGGHSKGGNFAMYAAAFCEPEYKERIVQVYNNDGPGFREEIIQSPEFQEIHA